MNMSAGTDTTGLVLAHALYELASQLKWYERLRAELAHVTFTPVDHSHTAAAAAPAAVPDDAASDSRGCKRKGGAGEDQKASLVDGGGDCSTPPTTEPGTTREFSVLALRAVQHLPLLNAVINETLRMLPVVPAVLSREAPSSDAPPAADGAKAASVDGVVVAGVFAPAGTRVSVLPYSLQRVAESFLAPDE